MPCHAVTVGSHLTASPVMLLLQMPDRRPDPLVSWWAPSTGTSLRRLTPNTIGTTQYAAPELMNEDMLEDQSPEVKRYLKVDVFSFGVTLWEILERKRPHKGMDPYQIQASPAIELGTQLPQPDPISALTTSRLF